MTAAGRRGRRAAQDTGGDPGPATIRKYPNRRLYNTRTGGFVTLEDLRRMVVAGEEFIVQDSKSGRDITPSILAQIIAEQEGRGESVLPGDLMRRLIALYDQGMSEGFFRQWQEQMEAFARNWKPFDAYGEMGKRNAELIRKSYETFFSGFAPGAEDRSPPRAESAAPDPAEETEATLQEKLDALQAEIDALRAAADKANRP